jgi:hypothetical protein
MKTVYDLIRHRSTLEVICGNCDNSRVFNHRFLMSQFGGGRYLAALKFVCRCGARRYRLRIVADSLGEPKPLKMQHFGGAYEKFRD